MSWGNAKFVLLRLPLGVCVCARVCFTAVETGGLLFHPALCPTITHSDRVIIKYNQLCLHRFLILRPAEVTENRTNVKLVSLADVLKTPCTFDAEVRLCDAPPSCSVPKVYS